MNARRVLIRVRDRSLAEASASTAASFRQEAWSRRRLGEPRKTRVVLLDEPVEVGDRVVLRDPQVGFNLGPVGAVLETFRAPDGRDGAVVCVDAGIPAEWLAVEKVVGFEPRSRRKDFLDFTQADAADPSAKAHNIFDFTTDQD